MLRRGGEVSVAGQVPSLADRLGHEEDAILRAEVAAGPAGPRRWPLGELPLRGLRFLRLLGGFLAEEG